MKNQNIIMKTDEDQYNCNVWREPRVKNRINLKELDFVKHVRNGTPTKVLAATKISKSRMCS
jgi:hypothetical protein